MIDIGTISFNVQWVVEHQIRLLRKFLTDEFELTVYDSTIPHSDRAAHIRQLCEAQGVRYVGVPSFSHTHEAALTHACEDLLNRQAPFFAFLDHDVFPRRPTSLEALAVTGIFGVQQACEAGTYLWPGLLVIKRSWLDGRPPLNLGSVQGGDSGSGLATQLTPADLASIPTVDYGYEPVLPESGPTQQWAVERIGDFVHLGNTSNWLKLPTFHTREIACQRLVSSL